VVAAIFAAAISTFDSIGSSLSALFTRDIYARHISGQRDDRHYLKVSRWATFAILALGFAYIPFISSKDTMLKAFLTLIPVFVTPLFTIYLIGIFTKAHARAGLIGLLTGSAYGLVALVDREIFNVAWLPSEFTGRWVALTWAMVFTSLGALVATLIFGKQSEHTPAARQPAGWLRNSSEALGVLPEHPFKTAPPRWLQPEPIAIVLIVSTAFILFYFFW
jgi:Na+/proline symporter